MSPLPGRMMTVAAGNVGCSMRPTSSGDDVLRFGRLEVDLGILPDLGVYEALEEPFEHPFQKSLAAQGAMATDSLLEA